MLTDLLPFTSSCRSRGPDSSLMIGSCINGYVSVNVVSFLKPSGVMLMFIGSTNGRVLGLLEVDGVSLLEPSRIMN